MALFAQHLVPTEALREGPMPALSGTRIDVRIPTTDWPQMALLTVL